MRVQETTLSPIRFTFSRVLLASLWLVLVTAMALSFVPNLSGTRVVAALASLLFIVMLIGHLIRTPPHASDLPDLAPLVAPRLGFWGMTVAITLGILLLLVVGLIISPGFSLLAAACLTALAIVITWCGNLNRPVVLVGLAAGLIVGLGIRFLEQGQLAWAVMNAIATPPVFMAGVLLLQRSKLGQVRLLAGQYRRSLRGFAWGCALAAPAAILNLMGGVQSGDTWVVRWWQPFAALDPAISEETGGVAFGAIANFLPQLILGIVWGYLYVKTNNLWASWSAHTLTNSALNFIHVMTAEGLDSGMSIRMVTYIVVMVLGMVLLKHLTRWFGMPEVKARSE